MAWGGGSGYGLARNESTIHAAAPSPAPVIHDARFTNTHAKWVCQFGWGVTVILKMNYDSLSSLSPKEWSIGENTIGGTPLEGVVVLFTHRPHCHSL